jgi:hypothetical protein
VGSSSPFTKGSPLYTMACHVCGGLLGVAGWNMTDQIGLARCWVLRGHPVWVVFSGRAHHGSSNARCGLVCVAGFGVGGGGWCGGVWLFVECCIVDASILLW